MQPTNQNSQFDLRQLQGLNSFLIAHGFFPVGKHDVLENTTSVLLNTTHSFEENEDDLTPLMAAVKNSNQPVIEQLIQLGADLSQVNCKEKTASDFAEKGSTIAELVRVSAPIAVQG